MISNTKTRNRMEDVAAERVIGGDHYLAEVDPDPICLTSFGDDTTGPPAFPCSRDDALVDNGAAAPEPCLWPAEMCTRTAAGGLLPAGTSSTAIRTIFSRSLSSWTLGEEVKGKTSRTNNNQLAPSYWRKVIETKSRQTLVFDPGGCTGRLRSCPFLGRWHALRTGWAHLDVAMVVTEAGAFCFWQMNNSVIIFRERDKGIVYAVGIAIDRCFPPNLG